MNCSNQLADQILLFGSDSHFFLNPAPDLPCALCLFATLRYTVLDSYPQSFSEFLKQ